MKPDSILLRCVILLLGLAALAVWVLVLPYGFRTDVTGLYGPIIIGLYVPAIPFAIALYQAWLLLGYIDHNKVFTLASVNALKNIKYAGLAVSGLFTAGMPYIFSVADYDDAPGVVAVALVFILASFVIATAAGLFQRLLQNAVDIKSENDLTV